MAEDVHPNQSLCHVDASVPRLELRCETKLLAAGQAATMGVMSMTRRPDHGRESADPGLLAAAAGPAGGDADSAVFWAPFAGADYATIDTETKVRANSGRIMAGMAVERRGASSDFLAAVFVEEPKGRRHLDADYGTIFDCRDEILAKGDIDSVDGGLTLRKKRDDGFRLEAPGRYGVVRDKYRGDDFNDSPGQTMDYEMQTSFRAARFGVGYKFGGRESLDLAARHHHARLACDTVTLNSGEEVLPVTSSRVGGGARFSRKRTERISFYAGARYEREFNGESGAERLGIEFGADPLLKGGTAIGEQGAAFKASPDRPRDVEAGVQLYARRHRGFSGGARFRCGFRGPLKPGDPPARATAA